MNFSAVILAGGKSSRMGRDKALLDVGGRILLSRQIALSREVGASEVFISGRADADYSMFGCRVVQDQFHEAGPLAGIEAAFEVTNSELLLVLAVDMPAINSMLIRRFVDGCTAECGVIPRTKDGVEPLAAIYPKAACGRLRSELQTGRAPGVRWFAQECVETGLAKFLDMSEQESGCLISVNSPEMVNDFLSKAGSSAG